MTVIELIEILKVFPSNHTVLLSRDEEGNGFKKLVDVGPGNYNKRTDEFLSHPDDMKEFKLKANAICLWP